ncbi:hypothetical protein XHV734_0436 [Xanthomonas hortorum pv. vitians]|nr:hypothetical protein XHV734_0436 [Xanthomonas hortorum pv. vitians]
MSYKDSWRLKLNHYFPWHPSALPLIKQILI